MKEPLELNASRASSVGPQAGFVRELGLFDSSMVVIGAMIGSGIFIVPADMARNIGSPGWFLIAWIFAGVLTIAAAVSYAELAAMLPQAGGVYVYLREAFSPIWGFLYGWTLFLVIQTGTIAAVAVAFARFLGVLFPFVSEQRYIVSPLHTGAGYAISLSTAQFVAVVLIALLTWANTRGIHYGKIIQNVFTSAKIAALAVLILIGVALGANRAAIIGNLQSFWSVRQPVPLTSALSAATGFGLFVAICVSQSGSLFSADAWHDITFAAGEVKRPGWTMPRALIAGTAVTIALYLLVNVAYLAVLPLTAIQHSPSDRVATAMLEHVFPGWGSVLMALAIMVSTFGCLNGLILAGPRVYYAMARDGMFLRKAGELNQARVPGWSLAVQGVWSAALVLPRTFDAGTNSYGNLYSNLLDYVISAALIFYVLTIAGVIRLRHSRPGLDRPYRVRGYPIVPAIYMVGATIVLLSLFIFRSATTWPGLAIAAFGLPVYWWRLHASRLR